jgi:hypothetical protein
MIVFSLADRSKMYLQLVMQLTNLTYYCNTVMKNFITPLLWLNEVSLFSELFDVDLPLFYIVVVLHYFNVALLRQDFIFCDVLIIDCVG